MAVPTLKHDAQGFLIGEPVQLEALTKLWQRTSDDVRAIRKAVEAGAKAATGKHAQQRQQLTAVEGRASKPVRSDTKGAPELRGLVAPTVLAQLAPANDASVRASRPIHPSALAARNRPRDAAGRFIKLPAVVAGPGPRPAAPGRPAAAHPKGDARSERRERDQKGRFAGGEHAESDSASLRDSASVTRIVDAIKGIGNAEELDPGIKAAQEVSRPIARTYETLMGGGTRQERNQNRWYRRFWDRMRRKDEIDEKDSRAIRKSLKAIENKPDGTRERKGFSLGSLIPGLPRVLGMGAGLVRGTGGLLKSAGGLAKAGLKGAFAGAKRIPILGTALTAIGGAVDMWDSETSDMSRDEKDKATGKAAGGVAGTLGGAAAGAKLGALAGAVGGPIGMAIGSVVGGAAGAFFGDKAGQVVGSKMGEFVSYLRDADIPGKFSAGIDYLKQGWDSALSRMGQWWDKAKSVGSDLAQRAGNWVGEKVDTANQAVHKVTGVDMKAGVQQTLEDARAITTNAIEKVANGYEASRQMAKKGADSAVEAIGNSTIGKGVKAVTSAITSKSNASQNKTAMLQEIQAQGITDPQEQAMIMAQMDHESAGFSRTEESFAYRNADRIMAVSSTARRKGKDAVEQALAKGPAAVAELMYGGRMGNNEAGDGYKFRGRGPTQLTGKDNYRAAGEDLGLDLVKNPDQVSDPAVGAKVAMWFWKKNNLGPMARAGDTLGVTKRLNGGTNGMEDRDQKRIAYLKQAQAGQLMPQPATAKTGTPDMTATTAAINQPKAVPSAASAPMVATVPTKPAPEAAPAPAVTMNVASAGAGRGFINPPLAEPGQDISDRRMAHVATGGIAGV